MTNYRNLPSPGKAPADLLPTVMLRYSPSGSTRPDQPFTQRYFEDLAFGVSSSQLERIDWSLVNAAQQPGPLRIFTLDIVHPDDQADLVLFERERSAFTRLFPTLMPRYEGQFVAVHNGNVVDSDRSSSELVRRFFRRFGDTSVYVGYVGAEPPVAYNLSPFTF